MGNRKMVSLFCDELRLIRKFECCPNCHEMEDKGEGDISVVNFKHEGMSVFIHGCCQSRVCNFQPTHAALDMMIRARKEKETKIEGELK